MKQLEDPLAKPQWPITDANAQALAVSLLRTQCVSNTAGLLKGFNKVMSLAEHKEKLQALLVSRSDIDAAEALPLALLSAAFLVPLLTLPKGASVELQNEPIFGLSSEYADRRLLEIAAKIGPVQMDWVYRGAREIVVKGKGRAAGAGKVAKASNKLQPKPKSSISRKTRKPNL